MPQTRFPSPLVGEGALAEAKPSEGGRGGFCVRLLRRDPLSRLALANRSALATLPHEGGGEESALRR